MGLWDLVDKPHKQQNGQSHSFWMLPLFTLAACAGSGEAALAPASTDSGQNLAFNHDCPNIDGFTKCCHEFSHPGECFRIDVIDKHPEETCANFCLLQNRKEGDSTRNHARCTPPSALESDLDTPNEAHIRKSVCKKKEHRRPRKLGDIAAATTISYCPLDDMYLLSDINSTCYDGHLIKPENVDSENVNTVDSWAACQFFDYNPLTRICCIPDPSMLTVPSFNRYTVDYAKAQSKWGSPTANHSSDEALHRRLGGTSSQTHSVGHSWMDSIQGTKTDSHHNKCPKAWATAIYNTHPYIFGTGATLNLFKFSSCLSILIGATSFIEWVVGRLEKWCRKLSNPHLIQVFNKMTTELMILGVISFTIFVCDVSLELSSADFYIELELAHLTLFFVGVAIVVQCMYLLLVTSFFMSFSGNVLSTPLEDVVIAYERNADNKVSWYERRILDERFFLHLAREVFFVHAALPYDFPFLVYINQVSGPACSN
jgi:hypothetical protein